MELGSIFIILVLILSIVIHEVAHGYAANFLGDPTARLQGRLTLNPISHIDLLGSIIIPGLLVLTSQPFLFGWAKPVPYNPYNLKNQKWGEAFVAFAGPATNIILALIFAFLIRSGLAEAVWGSSILELLVPIVFINILLALFNMIPIPPLDGSKILKAFLSYRGQMAFSRFEAMMAQHGVIVLFLFIFVFMLIFAPIFSVVIFSVVEFLTGLPLRGI